MHEVALAEGVLRIALDSAAHNGAVRIEAIALEIGALSHVEPDALRFCFDSVARGSIAQDAVLDIATPPGVAWCMPCGVQVSMSQLGEPCPTCGSYQLQVVAGDEMRVKEITIA
jgi:hydrogenase nickel incorporation protein HypA/HybF